MAAHLTIEQRQLARRLHSTGRSLRQIARELGVSVGGVHVMLRGQNADSEGFRTPRRWLTPALM